MDRRVNGCGWRSAWAPAIHHQMSDQYQLERYYRLQHIRSTRPVFSGPHHSRFQVLLYNIRMPKSMQLGRDFYRRNTLQVARELLGKRLVRVDNGQRLAGIISEVEAYRGEEDLACHARAGFTQRTKVMYGLPGYAYVYFTYGMHLMLNFVTEAEGYPAAVLIRAITPVEGLEGIAARRAFGAPQRLRS